MIRGAVSRPGRSPTKWSTMKDRFAARVAISIVCLLPGCGGGDRATPVTVAYVLTLHDESNSFVSMMKQVRERGVSPSKIECGLLNNWKAPINEWFIWIDGYSPRLAYLVFDAPDFAAVKDLTWYAVVDVKWRSTFDDPFDCGPLPPVE